MSYFERTATACFVTYEMSSVDGWASLVVRRDVVPTDEPDHEVAAAALASNAKIPEAGLFGPESDDLRFEWYELVPTGRSGLQASRR